MHSGPLSLSQQTGRVGALGYLPAFQYVVATAAALGTINDTTGPNGPLADGTFAAVLIAGGAKQIWTLDTNAGGPASSTVVLTLSGTGRWILMTAQPSTTATDFFTDIIYRPAGVAVPGLVYTAWTGPNSVESVATANQGLVRVWMDPTGSLPANTVTVPATANTIGSGMMEWHSAKGTGSRVDVAIAPGGIINDLALLKDINVHSNLSAATPLQFAFASGSQSILRMENSELSPLLDVAAIGMINVNVSGTLKLYLDQDSDLRPGATGYAIEVQGGIGGGNLILEATRNAFVVPRSILNNGSTAVLRDASVDQFVVSGVGPVTWTLIDKAADAFYDDALVTPVIVPAPIPGGASIQQAIDALKPFQIPDIVADPGWSPVTGVLTINHNKGVQYLSRVIIYQPDAFVPLNPPKVCIPDDVAAVSPNVMTVQLTTFCSGGPGAYVLPPNFVATVGI